MRDVECPYCKEWENINHDDGYGYEEDQIHEQQCSSCKKVFVYFTSISFYYEASQAPCKNDGEHKFNKVSGLPKEYYENKYRCEYCGEEIEKDNK